MNSLLLAAFGLVALGSLIRLVLLFTAPKTPPEKTPGAL